MGCVPQQPEFLIRTVAGQRRSAWGRVLCVEYFCFEMKNLGDLIHGGGASVGYTGVVREGPEPNTLANCLLPAVQPSGGAFMKCARSTGRIVPR